MNKMYPINYNIQTSVWRREQYKYSIILNIKNKLYKDNKLNERLVF